MKVLNHSGRFTLKSKIKGLLACGSLLIAEVAFSHELEIQYLGGIDTNPSKLSETLEIDSSPYAEFGFKLSHMPTRTGFYYDFDLGADLYLEDEEPATDPQHADVYRGDATIGFKWRPKLDYGRARFKWELYGGSKDGVYVRRATGRVARTPENATGIEIPDRFDATWAGFKTSGTVPISEEAVFIYDLYYEDKQYEELTGVSLSNLNRQQAELDIGFEKNIWPRVNLKTMVGGGKRIYEDRRAKDADTGDDIPGTELEFDFLEVENTLEYLITNHWKWQIGFDVDQRQDNEDGYYDSTTGAVFMRFRYRNTRAVRFLISASYLSRRFDNIEENAALGIEEDDLRERRGYRAKIELNRAIFENTWLNMDLVIGANTSSFENSNPIFTYDKSQAYVGFRWRPFN